MIQMNNFQFLYENFSRKKTPSPNLFDNEAKINFGKCKVCNDKATGIHYGVPTCESCKVNLFFFRILIT